MKKLLLVLLGVVLAVGAFGCGQDKGKQAAPSQAAKTEAKQEAVPMKIEKGAGDGKTLVVFFTAEGHTEKVAANLADAVKADKLRLQPAQPYTKADLDYHNSDSRTTKEMKDEKSRPQLAGQLPDLQQYETIYLGYPIWWGLAPHIVYTFVEQADLNGKKIIPFCTSISSGMGSSAEALAELKKQGSWQQGQRFGENPSAAEVKAWADSLK